VAISFHGSLENISATLYLTNTDLNVRKTMISQHFLQLSEISVMAKNTGSFGILRVSIVEGTIYIIALKSDYYWRSNKMKTDIRNNG
jgi:hypothetical protein